MIRLTLPYPPSVNALWRSRRVGKKSTIIRSDVYNSWRRAALWQLSARHKGEPVSVPYKLTIIAVRPDKRRRDLGNLEKAISDVLQDAKVITDDSLAHWIEMKWAASGPECLVIIETLEELNEQPFRKPDGSSSGT